MMKEYDPLKAGSIDGTDTVPHDRAIVRALNSEYRLTSTGEISKEPRCTVFVARLNPQTTKSSLQLHFEKYGPVRQTFLIRDVVTGFSKCYGFVEFKHSSDARHVSRVASGTKLDEHIILCEMEFERLVPGWKPRRLGGGLGGKKESGQLRFGGKDRPFRKPISDFDMKHHRTSRSKREHETSRSHHRFERTDRK